MMQQMQQTIQDDATDDDVTGEDSQAVSKQILEDGESENTNVSENTNGSQVLGEKGQGKVRKGTGLDWGKNSTRCSESS